MLPQIPTDVPRFTLRLTRATPDELVSGLIAAMYLVSEIANEQTRDIAHPQVSQLGRRLYYAELSNLIPPPHEPELYGEELEI